MQECVAEEDHVNYGYTFSVQSRGPYYFKNEYLNTIWEELLRNCWKFSEGKMTTSLLPYKNRGKANV